MGLSFRKSIKIGKNTRINFSKNGGVGISTGVKGARVSMNKKGVRTTLSAGGLQYRKDYSFKNLPDNKSKRTNNLDKLFTMQKQGIPKDHYTRHMKLVFWGWILLVIGLIVPPVIILAGVLEICGLVCMIKNWKRIREEHKIRRGK